MKKKVSIKCDGENSKGSKESDTECDKCDEISRDVKNRPLVSYSTRVQFTLFFYP